MSHRLITAASLGVAVLTVGAVAACSSSSTPAAKSTGSTSSGSGKTMELIVGTASDDFYVSMECGAKAEASKLGVKLTVTGPSTFSVPLQKPLIDDAIVSRPDALLVAPTDSSALDSDLTKVQQTGTKIVFVDTSSSDTSLGVSRISSDNAAGGKLAADTLGAELGGKGTVAVISVAKGVSTTDARVAGFDAEMAQKFPGIKLLAEQNDDADSVTTASGFIEDDIAANPNLNGVFAANVITAEGVGSGVEHAHKSGKVNVATFDADPTQMTMLSNGTINIAIAQEPQLEGADAVEQGLNAIEGKPVTANIATPLIAITKSNMNDPTVSKYVYVSGC
ncbi:MAG: ABC transporter substrate-binding protein [Streptosporangiaceae bacterium]|jgi:ribose transport system substrate-binding protein